MSAGESLASLVRLRRRQRAASDAAAQRYSLSCTLA